MRFRTNIVFRKRNSSLTVYKKLVWLAFAFLFLVTLAGWLILRELGIVFLGILTCLLLAVQFQIYAKLRQLQTTQNNAHRQIESLFSLFSVLKPKSPLPRMTGCAIYPDFGALLIATLKKRKPRLIVEAGSGVSSILIAYCLKEIGGGRLVSLEHDKVYADKSSESLEDHDLQDVAEVRHAPLKEVRIKDEPWLWYDPEQTKDLGGIDMLVIDGPPRYVRALARYPALPLLFHSLNKDGIVLLDDAKRADEKAIIDLWAREFSCFEARSFDTYKGAVLLRRLPH